MPKRWLVKKEMACCVRGYRVYKDIWAATIGDVSSLVCRCRKNFVVKLCSHKIFSYIFCVSISQCRGTRISNFIPFKTIESALNNT